MAIPEAYLETTAIRLMASRAGMEIPSANRFTVMPKKTKKITRKTSLKGRDWTSKETGSMVPRNVPKAITMNDSGIPR